MHHRGIKSVRAMCNGGLDVTDRMIGLILAGEVNPTVGIVDKIADYFGVPAWLLLIDGIDAKDMDSLNLMQVIKSYLHCNGEGRELLARMASHEAVQAITAPVMPQSLHRTTQQDRRRRKTDRV